MRKQEVIAAAVKHIQDGWCGFASLPCGINPILTFRNGSIGTACQGLGFEKKKIIINKTKNMILILTEKPSVAGEFAAFLGANKKDGYFENTSSSNFLGAPVQITYAFGHLLQIENQVPKPWNMDDLPLFPNFNYHSPQTSTAKQLKTIKDLVGKATKVIIATDCGREGELIARLILDHCKYNYSNCFRFWTSESLTEPVFKKNLSNLQPSSNYDNLHQRAIADNILKRIKPSIKEDSSQKHYYLLTNWWWHVNEEVCYSPKFIETNCSPEFFKELWSFLYDLDRLIYENPLENEDYIESKKILFYFLDELGFKVKLIQNPKEINSWIRFDSYESREMEVIVEGLSINYQLSKHNWSISPTTLALLVDSLKKLYTNNNIHFEAKEITKLFKIASKKKK